MPALLEQTGTDTKFSLDQLGAERQRLLTKVNEPIGHEMETPIGTEATFYFGEPVTVTVEGLDYANVVAMQVAHSSDMTVYTEPGTTLEIGRDGAHEVEALMPEGDTEARVGGAPERTTTEIAEDRVSMDYDPEQIVLLLSDGSQFETGAANDLRFKTKADFVVRHAPPTQYDGTD